MKKNVAILFFVIAFSTPGISQCGLGSYTLLTPSAAAITGTTVNLNWGDPGICVDDIFIEYVIEFKLSSETSWLEQQGTDCTSFEILSNLVPGETYNFRIKAHADCAGGQQNQNSSNQITVLMEPPTPVLLPASSITPSSFTINWNSALGATQYLLDVSTDGFMTFVTGYNGKVIAGTSDVVSSLTPGTSYSYRIRALNSSGQSANSTASIITLANEPTSQPTALTFSNITVSSINGSFTTAAGSPSGYIVLRRAGASPTGVPVDGTPYSAGNTIGDATVVSIGAVTSFSITTGLTANTVYYFDVIAYNGPGTSINYLTTSPLEGSQTTLDIEPTSQPTALTFSNIASNSLDGSFAAATGSPSGYIILRRAGASPTGVPVDGTTYSPNDVIGDATVVSIGASTSFNITSGLAANTVFHFVVIAYNGSGAAINYLTSSPLENSHTTFASEPLAHSTALTFSNITANSINGSFTAATGSPTGYIILRRQGAAPTGVPIDGTSYALENEIGDATVVSVGANTSFTDVNLTINTAYYYKVFSYNGDGASINYLTTLSTNVGSTFTIPNPTSIQTGQTTQSSIEVIWQPVINVTSYELEVSTFSDFNVILYSKVILAGSTSDFASTLAPSSVYYLRMKVLNGTLASAYSNKVARSTNDPGGTPVALQITDFIGPDPLVYDETETQTLSITTNSAGIGQVRGYVYHRKNTSSTYSESELTKNGNLYNINIDKVWVDDLGMQFYFEVCDQFGNCSTRGSSSSPFTLTRKIQQVTIPVSRFGKSIKNYHIISIPFSFPDPRIARLFEPIMGKYKNTKWRMGKYGAVKDIEYNNGLSVLPIEQGQAYWFISKDEVDLTFDEEARTYNNSTLEPFILHLKKGWNQIGNPFPFNIKWQDVLADNNNPVEVSEFREFNRDVIKIEEMDGIMEVFSGGFVLADKDIDLTFRTTLQKQPGSGGRMSNDKEAQNLGPNDWVVPITLKQGEVTNSMSGVGMRQDAKEGKDHYDLVASPRFVQFVELNTKVNDYEFDIARDIVPLSDEYTWNFKLDHNSAEPVTLQWDDAAVMMLDGQLVLHDITNHALVNMSSVTEYTLNSKATFKIYYSKSRVFDGNTLSLGIPYPNPIQSETAIPFDYSIDKNYTADVILVISDMQGKIVSEVRQKFQGGRELKQIEWNGLTNTMLSIEPGMYLFKLKFIKKNSFGDKNDFGIFQGKLIKQ